MKQSLPVLLFAVDLIILCVAVSIMIYTKNSVSSLAVANNNEMAAERNELVSSGINSLVADTLTGTQVMSAIRKYKDDYPVYIIDGTLGSVIESYNNTKDFDKLKTSIKADNVYKGSLNRNTAGNISAIVFTSKTMDIDKDTYVDTVDKAKSYILSAIGDAYGLTLDSSWTDIHNKVSNQFALENFSQLAATLGGAYSNSTNAKELCDTASQTILDLRQIVGSRKAYSEFDAISNSSDSEQGTKIGFKPSVLIVRVSNDISDAAGSVFIYLSGLGSDLWLSSEGLTETDFKVKEVNGDYYILNLSGKTLKVIAYQ